MSREGGELSGFFEVVGLLQVWGLGIEVDLIDVAPAPGICFGRYRL